MTANASAPEWRVIGETVPGASHLRAGVPNQDALLQVRESGRALPLVVSASDGHGSNKCFRSHRGSRFAVREAASLVGEFLDERRAAIDEEEIARALKETLPREFVRRWRKAVEADLKARPFKTEELDALEKKDGAAARKLVEDNPLLAYGATSLTVAVEESFIIFLQLGDGEILCVSETGEVTHALAEDARLFANETTSLCTADAAKNFRARLHKFGGDAERPALILVTTDGYANSFADEAGFLKVGTDLLDMLRADGVEPVSASLKGWLEEATRAGSGDDTTLAVICRMDALQQPAPQPQPQPQPQPEETKATAAPPTQSAPDTNAPTEPHLPNTQLTATTTPPTDANEAANAAAARNPVAAALKKALSPPSQPAGKGRRKSE